MDLHWLWQGFFTNWLFWVFLIVGGSVIGILKKKDFKWFAPIFYGLCGSAAIAVILLSFYEINKLASEPAQVTPETLESNIRTWLDNFHISQKKLDDPDAIFAYVMTAETGYPIAVERPKAHDRYLFFKCLIQFTPDKKAIIEHMSNEAKTRFLTNLVSEISSTGSVVSMDVNPVNTIALQKRVAITDSLTEAAFMQAFEDIAAAELTCQAKITAAVLNETNCPSAPAVKQ